MQLTILMGIFLYVLVNFVQVLDMLTDRASTTALMCVFIKLYSDFWLIFVGMVRFRVVFAIQCDFHQFGTNWNLNIDFGATVLYFCRTNCT